MAHFEVVEHSLRHGLLVAFRALDAVIETSAYGVGGPRQLWQITPEDGPVKLDDAEVEEIRTQVGLWQELERETLEDFLGGDEDGDGGAQAPLPETLPVPEVEPEGSAPDAGPPEPGEPSGTGIDTG